MNGRKPMLKGNIKFQWNREKENEDKGTRRNLWSWNGAQCTNHGVKKKRIIVSIIIRCIARKILGNHFHVLKLCAVYET